MFVVASRFVFSALLLGSASLSGCGDDDSAAESGSSPPASGATQDAAASKDAGLAAPDAGGSKGGDAGLGQRLPQGEFLVAVAVEPIGGLVLEYKLEIEAEAVSLRALDKDRKTSDVLGMTSGITQNEAGEFTIKVEGIQLPGAFTPTGSDIEVDFVFEGRVVSDDFFCGVTAGEIVSLSLALDGSTFGGVPFETDAVAISSCEGELPELERIADCPELSPGVTDDFESGGVQRRFELLVPDGYDEQQAYPLVFVFHAFGGVAEEFLDFGVRPLVDERSAIVVAPQAQGGEDDTIWDAFLEAPYNADVTLFDDLVKCVSESFSVDQNRVHATGMSSGGLMTSRLVASRSEVLASAVAFSGGFTLGLEGDEDAIPVVVVWGGEEDSAFEQDFNALSLGMIADLRASEHFVVSCNHGLGHELEEQWWPWAFDFLLDHPKDLAVEPYQNALPETFPNFCEIAE